jgi:hypothetical protein
MSKKLADAIKFLENEGYTVIEGAAKERPLADQNKELLARIKDLEAELDSAWTQRNRAVSQRKAWESIVALDPSNSMLLARPSDEWGPEEGRQVTTFVPDAKSITVFLEELAEYRERYGRLKRA